MLLDLPSGLSLEARKIKGHELAAMAERAEAAGATELTDVLRGCFLGVIDPGPYPDLKAGAAAPNWMQVLKGDVLVAIFKLRRASIPDGDNYLFHVRCEECGHRYDWEIASLAEDLPVKPLPEESKRVLAQRGRFESQTLSGVTVTHRLMTPSDDKPMKDFLRQIKRKNPGVLERLANLSVTIDGVQGAERDVMKRWNFFKGLDLGELNDLREKFEAIEGGIDLEIRTRCHGVDGCGWEQDLILPLRQTFFSPRKKAPSEKAAETAPPSSSDTSSPG